jgi:hypothetical protein
MAFQEIEKDKTRTFCAETILTPPACPKTGVAFAAECAQGQHLPYRQGQEKIVVRYGSGKVEASPRIELGCKDLQSSASPLRHEAVRLAIKRVVPGV